MPAMLAIMRPMNESTISSAEMSISTPLAPVSLDLRGQIVLQRHRQPVVHVDLDGDEQELAHPQDRDAIHGAAQSGLVRVTDAAGALERQRAARRPGSPWW